MTLISLTKYILYTLEPSFFQGNPAQMEGLEELHNNIMFYLAIFLFAISWIMISIVINFKNKKISNKYVKHGTLVKLI
jgi:cytochrome c oxidase subunit 2